MRLIDNKKDNILHDMYNYQVQINIGATLSRLWIAGIFLNMELTSNYLIDNIYNEINR